MPFASLHNGDLPCDVDGSGVVSAIDVLILVNELNRSGSGPIAAPNPPSSPYFVDVDADDHLSPLDVLLVVNSINRNPASPSLTASIAPTDDPNFNGVVLGSQVHFAGQSGPWSRIDIYAQSDGEAEPVLIWNGRSDGAGYFQTILPLVAGANPFTIHARDELGRQTALDKTWYRGDVVADWNATMLNAVRDWTGLSNDPYPNRIVPSRPPIVTRHLAMVHLAMFDAANAVDGRFTPYLEDLPQDREASTIAAIASAAHHVATRLYTDRDEVPVFDATLAASLALVPEGEAKARGIALGTLVAQRILATRVNDGSAAIPSYSPTNEAGRWNRTEPDFTPPELPHWGKVLPFALDDVVPFRVPAPPALDSPEYAAAVDEVMRLGRLDSDERTEEQTEIALFWADGPGTATPPGHWNRIAAQQLMQRDGDLVESARTLALLNLAMADSAIAAWDSKYHHDFWRPLHAIRRGDRDGNDATVQDTEWAPLLRTPAHPSYVSGHSTFSAAAATVLTTLLGDSMPFSSTTDPQSGLTQRPLAPELIVTREFSSFWQAADEASMSRIYGGIHFAFDSLAGTSLGKAVGEAIVGSWLTPVS